MLNWSTLTTEPHVEPFNILETLRALTAHGIVGEVTESTLFLHAPVSFVKVNTENKNKNNH